MSLQQKLVLSIPITISPKDKILEEIRKYLGKVKSQKLKVKNNGVNPLIILTPNPEIISHTLHDDIFKRIVISAQINIPDGIGTVWAIQHLYGESARRLSGADFMLDICEFAHKRSVRIGLIGGGDGVALKASECLIEKYPNIIIERFDAPNIILMPHVSSEDDFIAKTKKEILILKRGVQSNETKLYFQNLSEELAKRKIDILFVALGFPKQEYFIENLTLKIQNSKVRRPFVMMAVGGALDFISGSLPRAPQWMQNAGIEWLFRLIIEPHRLVRQLRGGEFFLRVLQEKIN